MAGTGRKIAALRAYVVDGKGGADYMDRDEDIGLYSRLQPP